MNTKQAIWTMAFFAILVAMSTVARAAEREMSCPPSVTVRQVADRVPDGWTSAIDANARTDVASVTFFDGPPSEDASLVYDSESRAGQKRIATWRFAPDNKRAVWMQCSYAATTVVLSKRLPDKVSECTVTYQSDVSIAGMPQVTAIRCKTSD